MYYVLGPNNIVICFVDSDEVDDFFEDEGAKNYRVFEYLNRLRLTPETNPNHHRLVIFYDEIGLMHGALYGDISNELYLNRQYYIIPVTQLM